MTGKCAAVVVAGGSGIRAGGEIPKQFQPLLGVPLLLWSVSFFLRQNEVSSVVIVAPLPYMNHTCDIVSSRFAEHTVTVVPGGARRQDSVMNGISATPEGCDVVAVHDGARPFPPPEFSLGLEAARRSGGCIFARRITDSIKRGKEGQVIESVPREDLWAAQTPQIGLRHLLLSALSVCDAVGIEVTDEAGALQHIGVPVAILETAATNLKVTLPEDWALADAIARTGNHSPF